MERFGIVTTAILLVIAVTTIGRPTSDETNFDQEIKLVRLESEVNRDAKPCYSRFLKVQADILQYEEIKDYPNYVPECDSSGIKWRASQCDHHGEGTCFCVREENGEILEHTKDSRLNKEALACGGRKKLSDYQGQKCFHMRYEFNRTQEEYGLEAQSPLPYYPDCTEDGQFVALQRNDRSKFFCVDTRNGKIIPETETDAFDIRPLTEDVCRAYDQVWQDFKKWNSTLKEPEIDENSCRDGFIFTKCGCPKKCTHKSDYHSMQEGCTCKPACVCREGMLELNGKCVTLEECHEAKSSSGALHADKLDDLTAGDYSKWKEYRRNNPNAVLETYNSLERPEARLYASAPAYDVNPNSRMLYFEPPPEEESEGQAPNIGPYGAEPIPIWGQRRPVLLEVLEEDNPEVEEVEEYQKGNIYGSEEPSQNNGEERYPQEQEFTEWEEEEGRFPQESEENEEEYERESEHEENEFVPPEEETRSEPESQEFVHEDTEEPISYGEDNIPPEEESYIEDNIRPEIEEENNNIQGQEPDESENRNLEEPVEEIQQENEIDEGLMGDESTDHQNEFTSVPRPEYDALQEHQASTPCEDDVSSTEETSTENEDEEDLAAIDRVLIENGVIPPKPIEATLEKPSPSIKKNSMG